MSISPITNPTQSGGGGGGGSKTDSPRRTINRNLNNLKIILATFGRNLSPKNKDLLSKMVLGTKVVNTAKRVEQLKIANTLYISLENFLSGKPIPACSIQKTPDSNNFRREECFFGQIEKAARKIGFNNGNARIVEVYHNDTNIQSLQDAKELLDQSLADKVQKLSLRILYLQSELIPESLRNKDWFNDWFRDGVTFENRQNNINRLLFNDVGSHYFPSKHEEIKELLKLRANPNLDQSGNTALTKAIRYQKDVIFRLLINAKANPSIKNKYGITALTQAIDVQSFELIPELLMAKANPNIQNNNGFSALHEAVGAGNHELVRILIEAKANPDIKNNQGLSSLELAISNQDSSMANLLKKAGASGQSPDELIKAHSATQIQAIVRGWITRQQQQTQQIADPVEDIPPRHPINQPYRDQCCTVS